MMPLNPESIDAFAAATEGMRTAVLGMVDAHPQDWTVPSVDSAAMRDSAAEKRLAGEGHGWGVEPVVDISMWGAFQVYNALEGAGALVDMYSSPRSYVFTPYLMVRFIAESSGRAMWLYEPDLTTLDRVARVQNLKIDDYSYRRRLLHGAEKSEMSKRIRAVRDAAQSRGLTLTPGGRRSVRFIAPGLPSTTEFAKKGLAAAHGARLSHFASAAIHGSITAMLGHFEPEKASPLQPLKGGLRTSSEMANMLLMTAGLALKDCVDAQFAYTGHQKESWSKAVARFMEVGRALIRPKNG